MVFHFKNYFTLAYYAFFKSKNTHARLTLKRLVRLFFWYTFYLAYTTITWICFGLDEIFFSEYRKQEVEAPIFIIGDFRTGSTFLFRLLAKDAQQFTALKTWEIYLAPSIVQRKFFTSIVKFDKFLFDGILRRWISKKEDDLFTQFPHHQVRLNLPEEDEGIALNNWASAWMSFIFPFFEAQPPYYYFDEQVSEGEKKIFMDFYKLCVQKHVYFHGGKRFLSKNPTFSSRVDSVNAYFSNPKYIYLTRNPLQLLPSKTNHFASVFNFFNSTLEPYPFRDYIIDLTRYWYRYPLERFQTMPNTEYIEILYRDLTQDLSGTVHKIYKHFDLPWDQDFKQILKKEVILSSKYVSNNHYDLEEMGYSKEQILEDFKDAFERFGFDKNGESKNQKKQLEETEKETAINF